MGIEGLLVRDSSPVESQCCVLEQDNLYAAEYWFNPGRQKLSQHDCKIVDWDVNHQNKQKKRHYLNLADYKKETSFS